MTNEKGKNVWWIMMILSCLFLVWTIFTIINGDTILENGLKMWAGSSFDLGNVEEKALGFMNMAMIKPLWEELWFGIFGVFFALKLKQMKKYAWTLGVIWSAMMLANGQHMFSCDPVGEYTLDVPLNANGEITLYGFCSGRTPFRQVLKPISVTTNFTFPTAPFVPDRLQPL